MTNLERWVVDRPDIAQICATNATAFACLSLAVAENREPIDFLALAFTELAKDAKASREALARHLQSCFPPIKLGDIVFHYVGPRG